MPSSIKPFISSSKYSGRITVPAPIKQVLPLYKIPDGIKWNLKVLLCATTVWPALHPPWYLMIKSASCANKSVIFALPSSPHCAAYYNLIHTLNLS